MELTIAQLKESYAAKSTEDLVKLRATRQLTDMACAVIDAELRTRGVEESAVDTVRIETEAEERERESFRANLAPIPARIAAYCIDFCGSIFVLFVIIFGLSVLGSNAAADAVSWKLVLAHWAYMLFKDGFEGQSLGKRLLGIQVISQTTGAPCGFPASLLRNLAHFLGLFDWVFIFGRARQRLGDRGAHTYVVVRKPSGRPLTVD